MSFATYLPGTLSLTGIAAGLAGYGNEVNPVIEQASKALPPSAPTPAKSASPTANPKAEPAKATTAANGVGSELPQWVKIAGYALLGLAAVVVGAKIVK